MWISVHLRYSDLNIVIPSEARDLGSCENGGKEVAIKAAQNYRSVRGQGYTIRRTIDCLIATFCLEAGHTLLHRGRYFDVFEKALGMKVVHA